VWPASAGGASTGGFDLIDLAGIVGAAMVIGLAAWLYRRD